MAKEVTFTEPILFPLKYKSKTSQILTGELIFTFVICDSAGLM